MDGSVKTAEQIMAEIEDLRQIIADFEAGETGGSVLREMLEKAIASCVHAEEELSKERNKFESMLGAMQSGITIRDLDFNIIYQNEPVIEIYGDRTGEKCYRVFEGKEHVCDGCPVKLSYEDGQTHTSVRQVTDPSGEIQFWENTANPIRDDNGKIVAGLEVNANITKRKKAEEELRDSEQRFRALSEAAFEGVVFTIDGKLIDANKAFLDMYDLSLEEAKGKSVIGMVAPECRDLVIEKIKSGYDGVYEHLGIKKDGSLLELEVHGQSVMYQGQITRMTAIRDITARKKAEREKEHLLRNLESKNKELQSIVYTASHDLKSPLVNIEGFGGELSSHCKALVDLLNDIDLSPDEKIQLESILLEDIPESLQFIRNGTRKMKGLLDGLLQVSRFGSADIQIENLDMNRLIKSILDTMQFQIEEKSISVSVDDLPGCRGDWHQISQVFSNILDNAIKYLDPDRKGTIQVSAITENGQCTYCVEDNGIGIDKNHQDKVFEIFHRLDPGGSIAGEGLGLTIATRILDRHNGRIGLESEPNKGTQFHVTLPRS